MTTLNKNSTLEQIESLTYRQVQMALAHLWECDVPLNSRSDVLRAELVRILVRIHGFTYSWCQAELVIELD
jgi:hypothetical protein